MSDTGINSIEKTAEQYYAAAELCLYAVEDATFAVRVFGEGPALFLIHGYPMHGYTWRKILPSLAKNFKCYVVDLPGLGDSDWTDTTDFGFKAQARRLAKLVQHLGVTQCSLLAHDTGATIGRLMASEHGELVEKLALINTEIPNHRPPWIRFYQVSAKLPLAVLVFRTLLSSAWFIRSSMGMGQFYSDKACFDDAENLDSYVLPLTTSKRRLLGMMSYLGGIDWQVVDGMALTHGIIQADVLMLWGANDQTFPAALAEPMQGQFKSRCQFVRIESASFLPHEEQAQVVLEYLLPFLSARDC